MKKVILLVQLMLLFGCSYAQQPAPGADQLNRISNNFSTEEYNSKLTSYMRVVADHITSDKSGYSFKMALIAFKNKKNWQTDQDFIKGINRFLRYTEVNAGVGLDKLQKVGNINAGAVFTLLNRRDSAIYVYKSAGIQHTVGIIMRNASRDYEKSLIRQGKSPAEAASILQAAVNTITIIGGEVDPEIDSALLHFMDKATAPITGEPNLTFLQYCQNWQNHYEAFAKRVQRKPLWTISPALSYNYPGKAWEKIGAQSEFLVSLSKDVRKKPWEIAARLSYYEQDDTSSQKMDLDQKVGSLILGINKVLLEDDKGQSKMELKFSGELPYNFKKAAEQKNPTLHLEFKYKLFQSIWMPLTISYDPEKGNLMGFINITMNLNPGN